MKSSLFNSLTGIFVRNKLIVNIFVHGLDSSIESDSIIHVLYLYEIKFG